MSLASAVLLVIPGPTILTVISYSLAQGPRARLPLVAAVALGDSTALALSLLGLGALLATSALWFTAIKTVGRPLPDLPRHPPAAQRRCTPTEMPAPAAPESRWRLFANTWLVTALNPKGMVFFVAFLPQFITPDAVTRQLWILAITFVVHGHRQCDAVRGIRGGGAGLLSSPRAQRRFNLTGGSLLTAPASGPCWHDRGRLK
jgi:threonine/homoserine/homoserine lactone efflux protein